MKSSLSSYKQFVVIIIFFFFSLISRTLCAQIGNDSLYQEGKIYLQLFESSHVELVLNSHSSDSSTQAIYDIFDNYDVTQIDLPFTALPSTQFDYAYEIVFSNGNAEDFIADLKNISIVEFAEQVPTCRFDNLPNDPSVQSSAHPGEKSYQLELIQLFDAFDLHTGDGALVAIVDNAIYIDHEDLKANIAISYDLTDGFSDTNPPYSSTEQTIWSHGTHVTGIAGATTDNGIGIASPGWNNKLMAVKICSDGGDPYDASLGIKGVAWAVANGAQVVNISWGGDGYSEMEYDVIKDCYDSGAILIAAAGKIFRTLPHYPAAYGELTTREDWEEPNENLVVAVASIDEDNSHSYWYDSFFDPGGSPFGPWVDISSYGTDIYSTVCDFDEIQNRIPNHYALNTGTSMAAPLVSGVAGLMRSLAPNATNNEIISCLINSANPDIYGPTHPENLPGTLGRGRLNALFALQCIQFSCENPFAVISASSTIVCPGESVDLTASDGQSYLWNTNATTQSISVNSAGTYSVTVDYGSCQATTSIQIDDISNLPFINVTEYSGVEPNDGILCDNSIALVTGMWGSSYMWSNGQETQTTNTQPNLPEAKTVSCTITDVGGCIGVDRVVQRELVWLPLPIIEISYFETSGISNDGTICANADIIINASGGESYSWSTGANTNYINVHPSVSTEYTVTVSDSENCTSVKTAFVFVTSNCLPSCSCINTSDNLGSSNQSITNIDDLFPNLPENTYAIWPSHCLNIQGKLIIDHPLRLTDVFVILDEGASIEIKSNEGLILENSFLGGCERLWRGITIESKGQLTAISSIIEDAEYAIRAQNKSDFWLIGNIFNNNYVSIYLPNEGLGNPVVGPVTDAIKANTFTSFGSIKEPYLGHPYYPAWPASSSENPTNKPFAGIIDNEVFGFKYDPHPLFKNKFKNLRNGIILNNVTQTIQNVEIDDMEGYSSFNSPSGFAIRITGGRNPVVTNSTIKNMHVGVWANGAIELDINHTLFQNAVSFYNAPATALLIDNHVGASIKYNTIIDAGTGIQMNRNNMGGILDFIIQDNDIQLTTNSKTFKGIDLNFIGDDKNNYKGIIDNNIIQIKANSGSVSGIRASNCINLILSNNTVTFDVPVEYGWGRGFDLMNLRKSQIHHNTMNSTGSVAQSANRSGLHAETTFNNTYFCNTISSLEKGLDFRYICEFTRLKNTILGSHRYGLYLKEGTTLSPQINGGNEWEGSYTYQGIIDGTDFNSILLTAQNSRFEANPDQNSLGHIYFPTNLAPTAIIGTWFTPNDYFAPTCSGTGNPHGGDFADTNIVQITRGKFKTGDYKNILNWMNQRFLFGLLRDSSQFTSLHTVIDSFYDASLTSRIGKLDSIDRALYMNGMSYNNRLKFDTLMDRSKNLIDSIEYLGAEFASLQLDTMDYLSLRNELEDSLFYTQNQIDSLLSLGYSIAHDHLEDIGTLNSNLSTSNDFESDQKQINNILINARLSGLESLSQNNWNKIEEFAFSCPLESGFAVYQAQSLLNEYIDTIYNEAVCDELDERSIDEYSLQHEEMISAIYPNPSSNGWNVVFASEEVLFFTLADIHGNLIKTGTLQKGVNFVEVENLPGVYILHVNDGSHKSSVYKLISIH